MNKHLNIKLFRPILATGSSYTVFLSPYPFLPPPSFLPDTHTYQLRAYLYQARDMYGSDKSGLSGEQDGSSSVENL